jgi:putative endonuclease
MEGSQVAETWWLYMIECRGGQIYTGIARDVQARYEQHARGTGAKYTRMNPPARLLCRIEYPDRREAARAECEMKRLTRGEKLQRVAACRSE